MRLLSAGEGQIVPFLGPPLPDWTDIIRHSPREDPVGTQWETRGKNAWRGLGTKGFAQKKVLSLVLCVAMLLSVMVMGTGAAFSDEDEFSPQYQEAAEVLTNLKVMQGYDDGSFLPQRNITRAQVATLIYRAATGDVTDSQTDIYSDYDKFDDVQSTDWFAGYVNYCGNAELIKGFTPTTFGPNKNVTGYQVLAMILRAVGYDQNDEFTGPGWEVRTASTAESLGILDNVQDATLGQPATRELVAELIFRAMIVPTVEYTNAFGYQQNKTTLGWNEFKLFEAEGTIVANQMADLAKAGTSLDDGKTAIVNNFGHRDTYNLTTDTSIIGEKVNVWIADDTAVSTPVSLADVTDWSNTVLDKDQIQEIKDATDRGTAVYNNYVKDTKYDSGLGTMVKAIDNNGDGDYEYILTETETLAVVQYVNTNGDITLDTVKSAKTQIAYDDIAAGDVVLTNTFGGKTYIEEAPYVTGYISGYELNKTDGNTATINGEDYMVSGIGYAVQKDGDVHKFNTVTDTYADRNPNSTYNGTTYNYYQDAYGNIRAYEKAGELGTQYGLILDYDYYKTGAFQGDLWVEYLTVDNEVATSIVDESASGFFQAANHHRGDVVKYRLNDADEFVLVYDCENADGYVRTNPDLGLAYVGSQDDYTTYNVSDSLVAFYYDDGGAYYGVLTGSDAIEDLAVLNTGNNDWNDKPVAQIDATTGSDTHSDRYGTLEMVNIKAHIDELVGFCYIDDFNEYASTTTTSEGVLYHYDAIDANGEAIRVTMIKDDFDKIQKDADADPVLAYSAKTIDGNTYNYLETVDEFGFQLLYGDLHSMANGVFQVYNDKSQTPCTVVTPEVYANAEGGTTELNSKYCSTGYVVAPDFDLDGAGIKVTTPAVFVTEVCDNDIDYVDAEIAGQDLHVKIGSTLCYGNVYANGTYTWTPVGAAQAITKDLTDKGCLTVEESMANTTVNVDVHEVVVTYAATVEFAKFDSDDGASFTLKAHRYNDGVEVPNHNVMSATADITIYTKAGTPVQTSENVAVSIKDKVLSFNTKVQLTQGDEYYAVITLTCNGKEYPSVKTGTYQAQPDADVEGTNP